MSAKKNNAVALYQEPAFDMATVLEGIIQVCTRLQSQLLCPFAASGCKAIVNSNDRLEHSQICSYRQFECALSKDGRQCNFTGRRQEMKKHLNKAHNNNFLDCEKYIHPLQLPFGYYIFYTFYENDVFNFHMKQEGEMLYAWLQHIGSPERARDYLYKIRIFSDPRSGRECQVRERCVNDFITFDEIIAAGRCAVICLDNITTYPEKVHYTLRISKTTN